MRALILAAALALFELGSAPAPRRVLFIGNSLTYANSMPAMVEGIARSRGEAIHCETVAFSDYSLEDHWKQGDAVRAIAHGGWSIVVLQQGPSALPESRALLREYVRRFDGEVRRVGARTALYMVWPSADRGGDFDGVHQSYAAAAADVGGLLLPAGDAWRAAWRRDPKLMFYGSDGFHPAPLGSYLAALVIYQRLSGQSPVGMAATLMSPSDLFPSIALAQTQATVLQESAAEVNAALRE